jgi:hypothetical protein
LSSGSPSGSLSPNLWKLAMCTSRRICCRHSLSLRPTSVTGGSALASASSCPSSLRIRASVASRSAWAAPHSSDRAPRPRHELPRCRSNPACNGGAEHQGGGEGTDTGCRNLKFNRRVFDADVEDGGVCERELVDGSLPSAGPVREWLAPAASCLCVARASALEACTTSTYEHTVGRLPGGASRALACGMEGGRRIG